MIFSSFFLLANASKKQHRVHGIHDVLQDDKVDPSDLNYATDDFRVDNINKPVKIQFGYKRDKLMETSAPENKGKVSCKVYSVVILKNKVNFPEIIVVSILLVI